MGLLIYDALVLAKVVAVLPRATSVLTLGVPTLNFNSEGFHRELAARPDLIANKSYDWQFTDCAGFFRGLGFQKIDALDISDYEGANIIGDLNDPALADKIKDRYDLIYDSGTIEHIFDAPTVLRTLSHLVRVGGAIVHATPANGFMDHGLWQCSPDLFRAFYRSAGFSILTSSLMVLGKGIHSVQADQNFYRSRGRKYVAENFAEAIAVFAAIKRFDVEPVRVQLQDYYASMHQGMAAEDLSSFFIEFRSPPAATEIACCETSALSQFLAKLRKTIVGRTG